jgi:hypothetical protein
LQLIRGCGDLRRGGDDAPHHLAQLGNVQVQHAPHFGYLVFAAGVELPAEIEFRQVAHFIYDSGNLCDNGAAQDKHQHGNQYAHDSRNASATQHFFSQPG